jgi:predicted nucleotidyltransferase
MRTLDEVIAQLRRVQPDLRRRYPIRELGIFGSYVRGEQTQDSDLDILVSVTCATTWKTFLIPSIQGGDAARAVRHQQHARLTS